MKIALAQMRVNQGRIENNFQNMSLFVKKAKASGTDLIAFPEMCLSGYLMADRWTQEDFLLELLSYNDKIKALSKELGIIIVYGSAAIGDGKNEDGRIKKYNAVYLAQNDKLHIRKKSLLANYRMFDDKRYFSAGEEDFCRAITLENGEKIGLEVCEDLWCADYGFNPTRKLISQGAGLIINVSASPFSVGKSKARDNRIKELKNLAGFDFVPFYYVNCVGTQNNGKSIVTFDGDSRIYDKNGGISCSNLNPYEEGLMYQSGQGEEGFDSNRAVNSSASLTAEPIGQKFSAILEAYKSMDELLGNPKYVFGLSGGVDSALNMALCSLALGKDKILACNLPSEYNSQSTKQAALRLCRNLGITLKTISIDAVANEFKKSLGQTNSITLENLQARIRTVFLMAQTSEHNAVLINNTNKVELALGYGTLYGDLAGAWCPIGDLLKTEIWELSRHINNLYGEIIPQELIPDENLCFSADKIRPSAELKENQYDPMIWGFDDWLLEQFMGYKKQTPERILRLYKTGEIKEICLKYNLDNAADFIEHLEWFFNKLYANIFKRIQAPPVLVLSKSAFGGDYRESQCPCELTQNYKELKMKILTENSGAQRDGDA